MQTENRQKDEIGCYLVNVRYYSSSLEFIKHDIWRQSRCALMVLEGLSVQLQASTSVWECKLHNWILVKSEDRSKRMTSLAACDLQREHERQHRRFRISMILWGYCYIFHNNSMLLRMKIVEVFESWKRKNKKKKWNVAFIDYIQQCRKVGYG